MLTLVPILTIQVERLFQCVTGVRLQVGLLYRVLNTTNNINVGRNPQEMSLLQGAVQHWSYDSHVYN